MSLCLNIILILSIIGCTSNNLESGGGIKNYNFENPNQFNLSSKLNEVSGLASCEDGNLLAINDEIGIIYKLNSSNGEIIKRFFLGKWTAEADFEGLTIVEDQVIAISSNGTLYKFVEGESDQAVDYVVEKLPFSSNFEIEGLFFDKEVNGLLIASKEYAGKKNKNYRAIYLYDLGSGKVNNNPEILISLKELENDFGVKEFFPSGISKHPIRNTYFIISAKNQNVIVEIERGGKIIDIYKLSEKKHRQPEGITFLPDGTLFLADEADGKKPTLTKYSYED